MEYNIRVERLFTLGDYKNIKVGVEVTGIPEEKWTDINEMTTIRAQIASEVLLNFGIEQVEEKALNDYVKSKNFEQLLAELLVNRHENLTPELLNFISSEPEITETGE